MAAPGHGARPPASHPHLVDATSHEKGSDSMTTIVPETAARPRSDPGSSSRWRGTRSPGSSAASASTPRSTSRTARSSSATARRRSSAATRIFMKGKDPRDAHFITSRICGICGDNHATCSCLRAEHGLRRQAAAPRRVDRQPRRGRRVHVRPQHLPGEPGRRRLLREDGHGDQPGRAGQGREHRRRRTPTIHGYRTIADIMRALNPFTGEFYREALQVSR